MQRTIAPLVLTALLVGCSTSAVPIDQARQASASSVYSYQALPATPYATLLW